MNEEFAITLAMILDNTSIQRVKNQLDEITKQYTKQNKVVIDVATNAKQKTNPLDLGKNTPEVNFEQGIQQAGEYSARLELLKRRMEALAEAVEWANRVSDGTFKLTGEDFVKFTEMSAKFDLSDPVKLQAELEGVVEKYNSIIAKQNKVEEGSKKVTKSHNGWLRSLKNILLGVIGVTSAYSAIRKAMSSYLAQNVELQQKINACWYALGSLFAPVLEYIVNLFVKVVSYVDALVKALGFAGINMSKYGKATGKAAKEQKQLAGFDEINNLSSPDNSSGAGGGAGNPFEGVEVKPEVVEFLSNLFKWLPTIIAGLWTIGTVIGLIVKALTGVIDPAEAIKQMGWALVIFGIVTALNALINYINDPSWFNFGMIIAGIGTAITGLGIAINSTPLLVAGVITLILGLLASFWPQIKSWLDNVIQTITIGVDNLSSWLESNLGWFGSILSYWLGVGWEAIKGFVQSAMDFLDGLFKGVKKIIDGIIQICRGDLKGGLKTIWDSIVQILKGVVNSVISLVNGMISAVVKGINAVIRAMNKLSFDVPSWIPGIGGQKFGFNINEMTPPQIPKLATGTNYVPNDMLAMLHQGEAVIPKQFNEENYVNSQETNRLLEQLINVVESKEFEAYISQNEIGKTAVKYINNQSRILGGSII